MRPLLIYLFTAMLIGMAIGAVAGWVTAEFRLDGAAGGAVIGAIVGAYMGTRIGAYRFARQNPEEALRQERIREGRRQLLEKVKPRGIWAEANKVANHGSIGIGSIDDS